MSYILEALRKSEQDRQRAAAPGLTTLHLDMLPEPGRPAVGAVPLLAGAGVVMLAVALVWTHPWRSARSGTPPADAAAVPVPAPRAAPRLTALRHPTAVPLPKPVHAIREERIAASRPPIKPRRAPPPQAEAAAPAEKPAAAQAASEPQAKPPSGSQEILAFSELPLSVQQALPKLSISGFVQYPGDSPGDADKRMIGIGEHLAQQGDEISPGLKVEQIESDRVVFGYKGYRFWLGVR